ncbi:S24 family peptidase [Georhizobium profundi]|uniref:S24 family peptidase n=2 Tax=Georhizobium profundi TaxID=2341112 RepID=A0A3Q8XPG6_9HYPH|nr:S24 family peptidase [Georhizobium profundi]
MNMKQASLAAGRGETFVRDLLQRDRAPSIENFLALAKIVDRPVSYLLGEEGTAFEPGLRRVEVAAHVQAGHFAESWEWEETDRYAVMVPDLPELRNLRLYAAETRGPSMNRRYAEKTVIVFNSVIEAHEEPIPGKRYVVERKRPGGEAEHTVKLLQADADGNLWLMPESEDPRFQAPISVNDGTDTEDVVTIIGRVVFAVTRE